MIAQLARHAEGLGTELTRQHGHRHNGAFVGGKGTVGIDSAVVVVVGSIGVGSRRGRRGVHDLLLYFCSRWLLFQNENVDGCLDAPQQINNSRQRSVANTAKFCLLLSERGR